LDKFFVSPVITISGFLLTISLNWIGVIHQEIADDIYVDTISELTEGQFKEDGKQMYNVHCTERSVNVMH
jgi:hypothetical protein